MFAAVGAALLAGCGPEDTALDSSLPRSLPTPTQAVVPRGPAPSPVGSTVTVTRVIDGDTFVAGGRTVRVLGIDSCESGTRGGTAATAAARRLLDGPVTLVREPGVTTGGYGRDLRYVTLPDGADFGQRMVAASHTGVYEGDNDASADYVRTLEWLSDGRSCGGSTTTTTTARTTTRTTAPPTRKASPAPKRSTSSGGGSAYYKNCSAARAAGAAPLTPADPGYRTGLDRDRDGVACE